MTTFISVLLTILKIRDFLERYNLGGVCVKCSSVEFLKLKKKNSGYGAVVVYVTVRAGRSLFEISQKSHFKCVRYSGERKRKII